MIEYYDLDEFNKLQKRDEYAKGCWVNLLAPTDNEINYISSSLNVPVDFFKDALDDEERSRAEREDENTLIITDFPYLTHDDSGFPIYETMPFGMIITEHCVITVSLIECPFLNDIISNRIRGIFPFKKTRFALQLLDIVSKYFLRYLKQINKKTNELEKQMHENMRNKELFNLMAIEKSLVYFTTSLKSNKIVLQKLLRMSFLKMYEEDKDLLEDVIIDNTQAIEMVETYKTILSNSMETFASVISNNLNIVMKFLASITIILSFPTIVASFFGMNFDLIPMSDNPFGFFIAMGISFILSITTAVIFWKKKYFRD